MRHDDQRYEEPPVFSLHDDRPGLINARKTFIDLGDPSGYKWAISYLGSWIHWQKLMRAKWFVAAYNEWVEELNIKLRSEALDVIRSIAHEEGNKSALAAARYIAELEKRSQIKGRPTKVAMEAELKRQVQILDETADDAERIGLKVINGGKNGN